MRRSEVITQFAAAVLQRTVVCRKSNTALTPAAVLVPLIERGEELTVLLTLRTDHLRNHAGHISFPGGRIEAADESPEAAALRETEEEIGVSSARIDVIGRLNNYETRTGFSVTPVVGIVAPPLRLRPNALEVAETFEVPLTFILDPINHKRRNNMVDGERGTYHVITYKNRYVWGLTAGILVNLYEVLSY